MGNSSRDRREARRRSTGRTTSPGSPSTSEITAAGLIALITAASRYAAASPRAARARIEQLRDLAAAAETPQLDPTSLVVEECLSRLSSSWEHGWQPLDLVHAARRRTSASAAGWITRAVLVEGDRQGAATRAPRAWAVQLQVLSARQDHTGGPEGLLAPGGRASVADWTSALVALAFLRDLPGTQRLMPPPSRWGSSPRPASSSSRSGEAHAKTVIRVRALLAKAESTEFAPEAEAFTAKAQDLMTRHAIDEALLADETGESVDVHGIRVLIDHPYAMEKARLLVAVGQANRTRAVWHEFASCMTLLGVPTDLEQVEMLFTSTLVQATRAMTQAGQESRPSAGERSTAFRKAFLSAYAARIGERLAESSADAAASYSTGLVPVLQRQSEAIDEEFERLFPHVTKGARRVRYDARGWDAGTRAADDAVLPAGSLEG